MLIWGQKVFDFPVIFTFWHFWIIIFCHSPFTDIKTLKKNRLVMNIKNPKDRLLKFISVILRNLVFPLNSFKHLTQQSLIWRTSTVNPTTQNSLYTTVLKFKLPFKILRKTVTHILRSHDIWIPGFYLISGFQSFIIMFHHIFLNLWIINNDRKMIREYTGIPEEG